MSWTTANFLDVVKDVSGGNVKTPQSEFIKTGKIPVIDQGKDFIAGFTNNQDAQFKSSDLPVVIFGDHTKSIKYVDFPFAMGADGVKVLSVKDGLDSKFFYHYLLQVKIPDAGYSRHYKFLKELKIPLPPLEEQRRIAAILDKAEALRAKRREAIAKLDQLLQAVFLEMFDVKDSGWAEVNVGDITDVQGGLQLSAAREKIENNKPYLRVANVYRNRLDLSEIKYFGVTDSEFSRTKLEKNDILIVEGHGNPDEIGRSAIWDGSVKDCTHQNHLIRCRINTNKVLPEYLSFYMNSDLGKFHLKKSSNTTSGLNTISVSKVRSLPVILAPIDEQKKWVNFQKKIEKMKNLHKSQLKFNDSLIYSLQSQYFQR